MYMYQSGSDFTEIIYIMSGSRFYTVLLHWSCVCWMCTCREEEKKEEQEAEKEEEVARFTSVGGEYQNMWIQLKYMYMYGRVHL